MLALVFSFEEHDAMIEGGADDIQHFGPSRGRQLVVVDHALDARADFDLIESGGFPRAC